MTIESILNMTNTAAFKFADSFASPGLNVFMGYLAKSFLIVLPLIAVYLYYKKDRNVFSFVFAGVLLFAVAEVLKTIFKVPRPCELSSYSWINTVGCEGGYGFPSSHAMTLTGLAFFVKNYKYLEVLYIVWLALLLFGRIYLGQHYFTDVLVGAVLSVILAAVLYRYRKLVNSIGLGIFRMIFGRFTQREFVTD